MMTGLTILQAKVLAIIAWADGDFDSSELDMFRDVLEASPGDDSLRIELFKMAEVCPERDDVIDSIRSVPREVAAAVIKNGYILAKADGHLHEAEMELLFELAEAAGVDPARRGDMRRMLEAHSAALELERELFDT